MKTIKRERHVRLDELVNYIWKNNIKSKGYSVKMMDKEVRVFEDGRIETYAGISENDLFTITEEMDITEDTKIPLIVAMNRDMVDRYAGWSIQDLLVRDKKFGTDYKNIYILNDDGSIGELIWSKEKGMVD